MKKWQKILSVTSVLALCAGSLSACGGGSASSSSADSSASSKESSAAESSSESASTLPAMTTDKITLTYASWENDVLTKYMAQKFMEKYPNITVETIYYGTDVYNDSLLNLVNAGQTPDCFWILGECDFAIENELLGDMTQYWENDPENKNILTTINDGKFGYYGTNKKWATPVKYLPDCIYANMTVFKQLNKEMPDPNNWTWEDFIQSIKDMTVPEQGIFGYNDFRTIITWYPIAADGNCWGEFGFDGTSFHMDNWAEGLNTQASLINGKYHAPFYDTDEAEAVFGDRTLWAAYSGKIAYQLDAWWTFNNLFSTQDYLDKGLLYVPYAIPQVKGNDSKHAIGTMDFGGISSNTAHPREAYELLKWMTWGVDGWKEKLNAYATLTNADGSKLSVDNLPITLDKEIWDGVRKFFPGDDDQYGRGKYFDAFFANCKEPIPYGGTTIPGFGTFIRDVYNDATSGATVEQQVINNGVNAHDLVADLEQKANKCHEDAMAKLK